ncbi:hypothetical protein FRC02_004840 [Tulasnella sp. 418]|nr:hypothetical protein FRC02_004840 [Tulasnella sp. 418]
MAFEASAGIVKWASNIHNRLQNDPTRAAFKELVQVQGFLFLEEYLEEVLKGPKDQPVIELAKTPGRRKETQKRTRAAVAAVAATATKLKTIVSSLSRTPSFAEKI